VFFVLYNTRKHFNIHDHAIAIANSLMHSLENRPDIRIFFLFALAVLDI
jgi:hypothetical protein